MKTYQTLATILDHTLAILSVVYDLTCSSFLSPRQIFVFALVSDDVINPYFNELLKAETISLGETNEKVCLKSFCLMDQNIQRAIKHKKFEFAKINVGFFSDIQQVFDCFSFKEIELIFLRKSEKLVRQIVEANCTIVPSVSMSEATSQTFAQNNVPHTMCRYYKESFTMNGEKQLTLIKKHALSDEDISAVGYDKNAVDKIMDEYYS